MYIYIYIYVNIYTCCCHQERLLLLLPSQQSCLGRPLGGDPVKWGRRRKRVSRVYFGCETGSSAFVAGEGQAQCPCPVSAGPSPWTPTTHDTTSQGHKQTYTYLCGLGVFLLFFYSMFDPAYLLFNIFLYVTSLINITDHLSYLKIASLWSFVHFMVLWITHFSL